MLFRIHHTSFPQLSLYVCNIMNKPLPVILVIILLFGLAPWNMVCLNHPTGHNHHHEPGTFSPCQLRVMCSETSFWPPMDCHRVAPDIDYFSGPADDYQIKISAIQCLITPYFISIGELENPYLLDTHHYSDSDPPFGIYRHRAPPFFFS
jgi:hypothetical protein